MLSNGPKRLGLALNRDGRVYFHTRFSTTLVACAQQGHGSLLWESRIRNFRYYSTPGKNEADIASRTTGHALHPVGSASVRTSRVELRPGPRPAQATANESARVSSNTPSTGPPRVQSQPSLARRFSPPPPRASGWQSIQEDFSSAEELGIISPPPPDAGRFKRFWHRGKEILKFYVHGLKLILVNARTAYGLRKRIRSGGEPLTYAEWHFVRTSVDDIKRLIPFALVVLVLEEALPFLVLYMPSLLPSTCVLPSQRQRLAQRRTERQQRALTLGRDVIIAASQRPQGISLETLDLQTITVFCGLYDISKWTPPFLRAARIRSRLALVVDDDRLLQQQLFQSTSLENMSESQLRDALALRGVIGVDASEPELRQLLERWITSASAQGINADTALALVVKFNS